MKAVSLIFLLLNFLTAAAQSDSSKQNFYSVSSYLYFPPGEQSTLTFIATADIKKLHFEGRYNYEDQKTGSLFAGWNFDTKGEVFFRATPMLGIVFGNTNAFAPGVEFTMEYKKFDFYSESEFLIDFESKYNNFLYTWGELAFSPIEAIRFGFTYQRTLLYETGYDIQRGGFAEFNFWKMTAGVYYFNPFSNAEVWVAKLAIEF